MGMGCLGFLIRLLVDTFIARLAEKVAVAVLNELIRLIRRLTGGRVFPQIPRFLRLSWLWGMLLALLGVGPRFLSRRR
ncbi:MAG: hypothetical protein ACYDBJ_24360 [Aggregatilineales bacterium]